jgi:hypothetical protein
MPHDLVSFVELSDRGRLSKIEPRGPERRVRAAAPQGRIPSRCTGQRHSGRLTRD